VAGAAGRGGALGAVWPVGCVGPGSGLVGTGGWAVGGLVLGAGLSAGACPKPLGVSMINTIRERQNASAVWIRSGFLTSHNSKRDLEARSRPCSPPSSVTLNSEKPRTPAKHPVGLPGGRRNFPAILFTVSSIHFPSSNRTRVAIPAAQYGTALLGSKQSFQAGVDGARAASSPPFSPQPSHIPHSGRCESVH